MEDILIVLGSRVRKLRKNKGYSQANLAEMAEVSITTISRLEQGLADPNILTVNRLADALDVRIVELIG